MSLPLISGIATQAGVTFMQLSGLHLGQIHRITEILAELNIETDMLQQCGQWPQSLQISFSLANQDKQSAVEALNEFVLQEGVLLEVADQHLAKISVVGIGIKSDPQLMTRIFALAKDLNLQLWSIATSENRFSMLIAAELLEKVAARLHQVLVNKDS